MYAISHMNRGQLVIERRSTKHNNANAVQRIMRKLFTELNMLTAIVVIATTWAILTNFN